MGDTGAALATFKEGLGLLETAVTNIQNAWNSLLDAVDHFVTAINKKLDESHWYNSWEWLTDKIKDALDGFLRILETVKQKFNEVFDRLTRTLHGGTPVISLFISGDDWAEKVEKNLSQLPGNMNQSGHLDAWHGPAHDTYKSRETDQIGAVEQTVEEVKSLSNWVTGVGAANINFITAMTTGGSPVIAKLTETGGDVAEAAATADPLSGQEALNDASTTVGSFAEEIINFLATLADRLADVIKTVNEQKTTTNDYTNFGGGHWPQAVNS